MKDRTWLSRMICTVAGEWGNPFHLCHPNLSEPIVKGQNSGIKMAAHKRSKFQASSSETAKLKCICSNHFHYLLVFSFHVCSEALNNTINQTNFSAAGKIQALWCENGPCNENNGKCLLNIVMHDFRLRLQRRRELCSSGLLCRE